MNAPTEHALLHHPLVRGLNPQQASAVTAPDHSLVILAGAGSGKTKVLTHRIAYLLHEGRAVPGDILAVTFTNKAANEMKERLATMVDASVKRMWIGTFHGLCLRMLRENARVAGLPGSFVVMDKDDQLAMIKRIVKDSGTKLPEDVTPKAIMGFIDKLKEKGVRAAHHTAQGPFETYALSFYGAYEARCAREGVVDFGELMLRTMELFRTSQEFADRYENRFPHLLVDEFQDTNSMQYEWLKALKGPAGVLFAVGDDDQSIYSFRGSRPENMMDFVRDEAGGRIVKLEQNYRSTGSILKAANALIARNQDRMGKDLWTEADDGPKVNVVKFSDDRDESAYVASAIRKQIADGVDPRHIAILYRANFQSYSYEKALVANGVPYVIYGGTKFFERAEVKDALAYMRLALNVNDDVAFRRVINVPARGIGETSVEEFAAIAKHHDICMLAAAAQVKGRLESKVCDFLRLLSVELFNKMNEVPLAEYMDFVITRTGLLDFYGKKAEDKDRVGNLREMVTAARRFCEESVIPDATTRPAVEMINEFLSSASLEANADVARDAENPAGVAEKSPPAVTLMTVHAAKGLEFDFVVIGGAEDGMFPAEKALEEDLENEERRLMYVALTRGRKNVMLTHSQSRMVRGEVKDMAPSRFLHEIPLELKDEVELLRPPQADAQNANPQKSGSNRYAPRR